MQPPRTVAATLAVLLNIEWIIRKLPDKLKEEIYVEYLEAEAAKIRFTVWDVLEVVPKYSLEQKMGIVAAFLPNNKTR